MESKYIQNGVLSTEEKEIKETKIRIATEKILEDLDIKRNMSRISNVDRICSCCIIR